MNYSNHSPRVVLEEKLYSLLYVNEAEVNKNREENKYKERYWGVVELFKVVPNTKNVVIKEVFIHDYKLSKDISYDLLFTLGDVWCTVFYEQNEVFITPRIPNISNGRELEYWYCESTNEIVAPDSRIKEFKTEKEALTYFNNLKLEAQKLDEKAELDEKYCSVFNYIYCNDVEKLDKLEIVFYDSRFEIYLKDVLLFWWQQDDCHFGARWKWLHKGKWQTDIFELVEKHKEAEKLVSEEKQKKREEYVESVLGSY